MATLKQYMQPAPLSPSILQVYYDEGTQSLYYADNDGCVEWVGESEQAMLAQKYAALFQQRGIPATPATTGQPSQPVLVRRNIAGMAAMAAATLTGCQQSADDSPGQGIAGFAIAIWICILATTACRALTKGGKWTRWCAWTGVLLHALCETSGARTEKSRMHSVPAAGHGRERVTCPAPVQGRATKEEVCLKTILPVGFCHHEQAPRARDQDCKRGGMSPSGRKPNEGWLDNMKSARATILHVEPPNKDSEVQRLRTRGHRQAQSTPTYRKGPGARC